MVSLMRLAARGAGEYGARVSSIDVEGRQVSTTPFVISNDLLGSPEQLRERANEDGYVFFRDLVDQASIKELRGDITRIIGEAGWLDDGTDPFDGISTKEARLNRTPEFIPVYDAVQCLESFQTTAHNDELLDVAEKLLGEPGMPQPSTIVRMIFPNRQEHTTPPHQDFVLVQGTPEVWTCWIPLGACPQSLGGLAVLKGSHRLGVLPVYEAQGAGGLRIEADALQGEWHFSDFELGDALFFHSKTAHQGLPNVSGNRLRLSVDYRYQKKTDLIMEKNLGVHQGRITWAEVYKGWKSEKYQYYWEEHQRESVPRVPSTEFR